jgi:hypothetical protein
MTFNIVRLNIPQLPDGKEMNTMGMVFEIAPAAFGEHCA